MPIALTKYDLFVYRSTKYAYVTYTDCPRDDNAPDFTYFSQVYRQKSGTHSHNKNTYDTITDGDSLKKNPKTRVSVPWWNRACDKAVRDRNCAYRLLRRCPTENNALEYKRLRAKG